LHGKQFKNAAVTQDTNEVTTISSLAILTGIWYFFPYPAASLTADIILLLPQNTL